jgi:hypothetical protein
VRLLGHPLIDRYSRPESLSICLQKL